MMDFLERFNTLIRDSVRVEMVNEWAHKSGEVTREDALAIAEAAEAIRKRADEMRCELRGMRLLLDPPASMRMN